MKIRLISPTPPTIPNGNRMTALRWARIFKRLGHTPSVEQNYRGGVCDVMIALHARRSFPSVRKFRRLNRDLPLIVVLTGTDLYRDIARSAEARQSLELATRLIVLQPQGLAELPARLRGKTRVVYQSAERTNGRIHRKPSHFRVCVIGHLRAEKDPFRAALAVRALPDSSRVRVLHVGRALTARMQERALAEAARNQRYEWLGELPHPKTRKILAESQLLALTSRMEGSSNVLSEAIASSIPVVASRIPGLIGTLGEEYPGYFTAGSTRELSCLLQKVESDQEFYRSLKAHCVRIRPLVDPELERSAWQELLAELS